MNTITIYQNRAVTLRHTYKTEAGVPVSVAGLIITGALKRRRCDAEALITLTTEGASPNIDIIESGDDDIGVYDVSLTAADTADLVPGMYVLGYSQQSGALADKEFFGEAAVLVTEPVDD